MTEKFSFEQVQIHTSQFPQNVYQAYLNGFCENKIAHKFHYDSVKQSQKWLALHHAFSPSWHDQACILAYTHCFEKTMSLLEDNYPIEIIGLGCGEGSKDNQLISNIVKKNQLLTYYPIDVSLALAMMAAQRVRANYPHIVIKPIVCDLLFANDLMTLLTLPYRSQRILTFFGMMPNFLPHNIMPILSHFLKAGDLLMISANLAPGKDYEEGVKKILPQYDNALTQDWLFTVLNDAGISSSQGHIVFNIENDSAFDALQKIVAYFEFSQKTTLTLDAQTFAWQANDKIQLFYSYRYTTKKIEDLLSEYGITVIEGWEAASQEEAIYLCQKSK
jgi:uncharacterized SAM-dependent methyltransferase